MLRQAVAGEAAARETCNPPLAVATGCRLFTGSSLRSPNEQERVAGLRRRRLRPARPYGSRAKVKSKGCSPKREAQPSKSPASFLWREPAKGVFLPTGGRRPTGRSHPGRRPATLKSRGFRWLRPRTNKIPAHSRAPAPPGNPKTRKKAAPRRRDAASDRDQRGPLYRFCRSELSATTMFLSIRSVTSPSTSISSVVSLTSFTTP